MDLDEERVTGRGDPGLQAALPSSHFSQWPGCSLCPIPEGGDVAVQLGCFSRQEVRADACCFIVSARTCPCTSLWERCPKGVAMPHPHLPSFPPRPSFLPLPSLSQGSSVSKNNMLMKENHTHTTQRNKTKILNSQERFSARWSLVQRG